MAMPIIERLERLDKRERKGKLMSAPEAVRLVRPGSTVHLATTHSVPFGLTYELTRQFWGRRPGFQLVTLGASVNVQVMIRDPGFLRRVITSYAGNVYPAPSPATVFQENYRSGGVTIENWSLLTLVQRLMAGALGLPFIPTNSLSGSGMEAENKGTGLAKVSNPFADGDQLVLSALAPDYTLAHGWAADSSGNILARSPWTESNYGAMAAREGVIASVDRIVGSDFVRSHNEDLLVPSSQCIAVVDMPYGAHPSPCRGYPPEWGYSEDEQFLLDFRNSSKDLTKLDAWAKEWVLATDQAGYVKKLGLARMNLLRERAFPDAWKGQTSNAMKGLDLNAPPKPVEQMVLAMAQVCVEQVRAKGYRSILAGQGTSNLSAWMAYYMLAEERIDVDLMAEIGLYGYSPRPSQPLIFNSANIATCTGLGSALDVLGVQVTGARRQKCIGMLGAAIIDQYGNVDSTCVPEMKTWLLGSGGANDVLSGAAEVVVCCPHDAQRLWPQVPYATGFGDRVTALVTTKAIFRKPARGGPFILDSLIPPTGGADRISESLIAYIRENTGWEVEVAAGVRVLSLPKQGDLQLLRAFDPQCHYLR